MRAYLLRLTAGALLSALIRRMAPDGGVGRAVRLGAGLLVLVIAFSPLRNVDPLAAAERLGRTGFSDPLDTEQFTLDTNGLLSGLISSQAEAYILDKARELGMELEAEVSVQPAEGYPAPWSVVLTGTWEAAGREVLSGIITRELAIPESRQEWCKMG